jgi:hypothetical protein
MTEVTTPRCEADPDSPHLFIFVHDCFRYELVGGQRVQVPEPQQRRSLPLGPEGWLWSEDKTTITPSIECGRCGTHGFWRDGRWIAV